MQNEKKKEKTNNIWRNTIWKAKEVILKYKSKLTESWTDFLVSRDKIEK